MVCDLLKLVGVMRMMNTVKNFIVESFLFGDDARLGSDTSFFGEGIIDSTGILELIMFLEETFEIQIEDDELIPDNLDTLSNVAAFVTAKQGMLSAV